MPRKFNIGIWLFVFGLVIALPLAVNFQLFIQQLQSNPLATAGLFAVAIVAAFMGEHVYKMK